MAAALRNLSIPPAPLTYLPLTQPVTVRWRAERPPLLERNPYAPVLEVHAVPTVPGPLTPVAALSGVAERLAARGREIGFFGQADPLTINHDSTTAWVVRSSSPSGGGFYTNEARTDPYSGLSVGRDGSAMIFQALPTDSMGALIERADLKQRLSVLLRILAPHLPATEHIALAAALDPTDRVNEGDPSLVGHRNSASGASRGGAARAEPVDQVPRASLGDGIPTVADELAVRLLQALRDANGPRNAWR